MTAIKQSLKIAAATFFVAVITFQTPFAKADVSSSLEKFFENLGFRDYSSEAAQTLKVDKTQKTLTVIQKQTLTMNQERYESFNAARRLAIRILTPLYTNPTAENIAKVIKLTASQMAMKPAPPPQEWPSAVAAMAEKTQAEKDTKSKAQLNFVETETLKDINAHTLKVVSDIVTTLYGDQAIAALNNRLKNLKPGAQVSDVDKAMLADLKQISTDTQNLIAFLYLDGEMGDNLLGQTLALGLSKFEFDQNKVNHTEQNHSVTTALSQAAANQGEDLRDYIGSKLVFQDKKRGDVAIQFHSGMIIAERAAIYPQESSELAWAARPGSIGNWFRAFKLNFLGDPVGMLIGFEDGGDKPQSFFQKIRYGIQQLPIFNRGLSHAGWAYVFKDPETGIEAAKAVDIYPGVVHGGIRISRIKKFAARGINLRFATTKIDALRFRKWAREQIEKGQLSEIAWDGKKEFVDENGEPILNAPSVRDDWKTSISTPEVIRRFNAYTDDQAEEWFENEVIEPSIARAIQFLTTDGVAFAENFSDYKWRSYCSKLVALTVKMESGFDIQTYPDQFNIIARAAGRLGLASDTDFNQRIVAPGGLFWQGHDGKSLSSSTEVINNPDDGNFHDRMAMQFTKTPAPFSAATSNALVALKVISAEKNIPDRFDLGDSDNGLSYRLGRAIDSTQDKADKMSRAGINRAGVSGPAQGYLGSCPLLLNF